MNGNTFMRLFNVVKKKGFYVVIVNGKDVKMEVKERVFNKTIIFYIYEGTYQHLGYLDYNLLGNTDSIELLSKTGKLKKSFEDSTTLIDIIEELLADYDKFKEIEHQENKEFEKFVEGTNLAKF